ncbi:hypothetical protein [Lysinibacillus telephonicus]|uniref:hypothetical protein n=1 Tax=Lysinibacillus telephonicus TaxID=1714840 RepID=UPI0037D5E5A6
MKSGKTIECPYCKKEQFDTLDDLVDSGDMEGSFPHECENCNNVFTVEFEYRPYNRTTK